MNRKVAKLIRGFCKITQTPYRAMKLSYMKMKPEEQARTKRELLKFWQDNEKAGLLNHKNYYELKEPLEETMKKLTKTETVSVG